MNTSVVIFVQILIFACLAHPGGVSAEDSVRSLIDQRMTPVAGVIPAICPDAEFLRRVSLDLTGMPPAADEARAFLVDSAADKREKLVERLLASPQYARHIASTFDLMLMERRANTHVTADEWQAWLLKSVRENKPWNVMAREILAADGDDPNQRPAARFSLDRGSEPNLLTHDISRIFFGRDMQCAQCHDHPIVADYLQSDYHGLLAYIAPGYAVVRKEGDKEITLLAERAGSDLSFESVFVKGTQHRTGPRMPDDIAIDEPLFLPGDEYKTPPGENVKSVPKFSRRTMLADLATNGSNQAFNQNIANRLWAHMFGRGLVHPLDLHHPDNPAIDPELLRQLGTRFASMNFDVKSFLREIALSDTYQRAFDGPADLASGAAPAATQVAEWKQQIPALAAAAKQSEADYSAASAAWLQAEAALLPVAAEFDAARNAFADARKKADEVSKAIADAVSQQEKKRNSAAALMEAADASRRAAAALPDDRELSDTAAKLLAKSEQMTVDVAALAKTVEEKTAALKPLAEAQEAAKTPIDAALAKLAPFQESMRSAEQALLAARRKAAAEAQLLAALDRKIHTAQSMSLLPERSQAITAAENAAEQRAAELGAKQQQLAEYAVVVARNDAALQSATAAVSTATNAVNIAAAEHADRKALADAVSAALASVETAAQKAADDPILAEVTAKLKDRTKIAQTEIEKTKSQLDAAADLMTTATAALTAAQTSMSQANAERSQLEELVAATADSLAAAKADLVNRQTELSSAVSELDDGLVKDFTAASLKPLTPEQLCWSVFRVTGVYDRYWQAEVTELDKTSPVTEAQKLDA
ncbi:MAG: DUF1549 domain-containing protein, partial [Planctomycetaceae bacterium]|nr:DUF1549 domain-containing protein [Planctomycetaceae bacterium]